MIDDDKKTETGGGSRRLALNTLSATRKALARVARAYWSGSIGVDRARTMGYLLSQLVGAFKTEAEARIESRLDQIEAQLAARETSK